MGNLDTVKEIYEAFGRGDVPAIIEKLDDNVEWDTESTVDGVPWMQPRRGKANVPAFFESLAPLTITRFEPHTFFENDNKVFVLIALGATHNASGKQYLEPNEGHLWVFNGAGKVTKFQHVADTALHWRMANGR
jgi:uncharacterized protein